MATAPQFATTPNSGAPGSLTAANTALTGAGATGRALIFTAGASGSILPAVLVTHLGSNVATVARVFRNNGSDPETASNNTMICEVPVAANTLSQVAASSPHVIAINQKLKAGERIYVTIGTAVAAGLMFTPVGGGDF